jgi:hypothetical protein
MGRLVPESAIVRAVLPRSSTAFMFTPPEQPLAERGLIISATNVTIVIIVDGSMEGSDVSREEAHRTGL